jgi:PAS domain S-box-containing protein
MCGELNVNQLSGSTEMNWSEAFHAFGDAVCILDAEGIIRQCNQAMSRLLGVPVEHIQGQNHYELLHHTPAPVPDCSFRRSRESRQREEQPVDLGGRLFHICTDPIFDIGGTFRGAVLSLRDITEHRQSEDALIEARGAAEFARRAESNFVANISHELRTPLHGILGMLELAMRDGLTPAAREYLQVANESAEVLLGVLNQILDFSRVDAGKLVLEEVHFNLSIVLDQVIRALGVKTHRKALELYLETPRHVPVHLIGDALRLREVLTNLVDNAIKFTEHGEVVVRVEVQSTTPEEVFLQFSVVDSGMGLSAEEQQQIFDPFYQADRSSTRRHGGTGLGLPISCKLVGLMGGRMQLQSELGQGSTFSFTVPFRLTSQFSEPSPLEIAFLVRLRDVPVLVVDTHATSCRILCQTLQSWGMKPEMADHGQAALAQAQRAMADGQPFPLVLVNASVPDFDKGSLIRRLREHLPKRAATIVVACPSDQQALAKRRRSMSKALFLSKPVTSRDLLLVIARGLGLLPELVRAPAVRAYSEKAPRSLRILLAEDTTVGRFFATEVLQERGHVVHTAEDGRQAFELVRDQDFDVILLDIQMPIMDGFLATSAIRALPDPLKSQLPIIAISAHATRGYEQHCLAAGMNGYLSKPLRGQTLIETVERLTQRDASTPT